MEPPSQPAMRHGSAPRVMASSSSVVQQARLMESAGTAWHAVKCGNLEMITKLFPNKSNVYAKGPVGENVLHVAMLLNTPSTLAITRFLVKMFGGQLVNTPIQERRSAPDPPGTYEGQTALHIAIVNKDMDMVKFLVQHGANVRARAWGTFFRHDGPTYYGEYPLSFAVSTGQKDVIAYLIRHGARVDSDRDMYGNNALHMAVIHNQPDMYDFLVDLCGASREVVNHHGLTPLVLAAQLGKLDMFRHISSRRRRTFYSFGRVTSYSLPLREIDTVQGDEGSDGGYVPNALEVVVRKRHLHMLEEPLLHTLLQHKWEAFARAQFLLHFLGYLLLEVSQTILIWLISDRYEWNRPPRASQEFLSVILALCMLVVEVSDYINWGRECYHRRLTMVGEPEPVPPLYPIPGEMRDGRDGRQGIFARLSARMGFHSHTSHGGSSFGHHSSKTDGSTTAAAAAGSNGRLHQQQQHQRQQQQQQQQQSRLAKASVGDDRSAGDDRSSSRRREALVADAQRAAMQQQTQQHQQRQQEAALAVQLPEQQPEQQQQLEQDQQTPLLLQQQRPTRSPFKSNPSSPPHSPRPTTPAEAGGGGGGGTGTVASLSPARSGTLRYSVTDTPINLEPYLTGAVVVGAGKSPLGVGVVDSGLTAQRIFPGGAGSVADASSSSSVQTPAAGSSSRPVGEGTEEGVASSSAAAAAAAAVQQPGGSVSPPIRRVRSHPSSMSSSGQPSSREGSQHGPQQQQHQQRVTFAESPFLDGSSSGSPRTSIQRQQQQGMLLTTAVPGDGGSSLRNSLDTVSSEGASLYGGAAAAAGSSSGIRRGVSLSSISPSPGQVSHMLGGVGSSSGRHSATTTDLLSLQHGSPADVTAASHMLERQRTRARSGGGDLMPGLNPKRSQRKTTGSDTVSPQYTLDGAPLSSATTPLGPNSPLSATTEGPTTTAAGAAGAGGGGGGGPPAGWTGSGRFAGSGDGGGGPGGVDVERVGSGGMIDPHKTRVRALLETSYEGAVRMIEDPWLFVWHLHLLLTLVHFLIWISSYGFVGGNGPSSIKVRQLDDVIVSMMGLSGWLAVIYFFRGFQPTGRLAYILERCIADVLKFVSLFILWDMGFALAFYTMQNGVLAVAPEPVLRNSLGITQIDAADADPFSSIGYTMVTLINLGAGLSHYEYAMTCASNYPLTTVFCTIYYLLYITTVVLLLMNLLTAMIITTVRSNQVTATAHWRHRWAIYVLKAERRLPAKWAQRLRLGTPTRDTKTGVNMYSHVFESVDDDVRGGVDGSSGSGSSSSNSKALLDSQIRGLEAALEEMRRKKQAAA